MEIEKVEIKQEGTHFQDTLMLNSDMCNDSSPKKQELVDPTDELAKKILTVLLISVNQKGNDFKTKS